MQSSYLTNSFFLPVPNKVSETAEPKEEGQEIDSEEQGKNLGQVHNQSLICLND